MLNKFKYFFALLALTLTTQVFALSDDFTQATVNDTTAAYSATPSSGNGLNWVALGYACLTAGTTSNNTVGTNSNIPGCNYPSAATAPAYSADAVGYGALRLTPAVNSSGAFVGSQSGSIVSTGTMSTGQGLQITFTTYTYGGNTGGTAGHGADGMSFFIQDATYGTTVGGASNIGAFGGSLGYSCAQGKGSGLTGAYLGLGIDEYGNFLNSGDNTATGILNTNATGGVTTYGSNTWYSSGNNYYQPNRIGMRGAGNVSWYWLNSNYPNYYPSTLSATTQLAAVENTCKTGTLWNYGAGPTVQSISGTPTFSGTTMTVTVPGTTGYTNGDTVTLGGTITANSATQSVSGASVSGTTMTVSVPSTSGLANGNTVTLGGTITATSSGQTITSYGSYSSANKTVRVYLPTPSAFSGTIAISGASGTNASLVNGSHSIASVQGTYIVINVASGWTAGSYPSGGTAGAGVTTNVAGGTGYSISNLTSSSFTVQLGSAASSVVNTSGTVTGPSVSLVGSYTMSNVTSTTFDVTLASSPASITNTSGTAVDSSLPGYATQLATTVADYAVIPGGYWVLPNNQPIPNQNSSTPIIVTRTSATPITYKLIITPGGYLTFMYNYNNSGFQTVLPNYNLGALPANFRFGFAGSTGGSYNIHDITCFAAQPLESASSASGNAIKGQSYHAGTQVYFASYNNNDWSGSVVAAAVTQGTSSLSVAASGSYTWDADCLLTGNTCTSTGNATNASAMAPAARVLLAWDASTGGVALESANITSAQTTALNTIVTSTSTTDSNSGIRLDWLRGGRSNELTAATPGPLRARNGVLGDIVNSSPTWVGPPSVYNFAMFTDAIYGGTPAEAAHPYSTAFSGSTAATRLNVVYAGSNDGMVHGFEAGSYKSDGVTYVSTNNDGKEVIGYMPSGVLTTQTTSPNTAPDIVSLTEPTYGHNYFVDATPGTGDLYYNGAWHTWLVGGLGEGGTEIYALDVTDPSTFKETNAASLVIGDWTALGANMGKSYGTPIIRRLHNGKWAIIFGNGINSTNQHAGVFIGVIDSNFTPPATSANVTFYFLDTGTGSATTPDGISYVTSADLDGDHIADYLYAGDLLGNVWRFDLTSNTESDWGASKYGQASATPLFTAQDSSGTAQPITSSIVVSATYTGGSYRIILGFGTGQATPFGTGVNPPVNTYYTGQQTAYGIWDWDFNDWNNGRTITRTTPPNLVIPGSAAQYASLPEAVSTGPTVYRSIARSNLYNNSVTSQTNPIYDNSGNVKTAGSRTVAISTVNWCSTTACASPNNQYGWMFDLPDTVSNTSACGGGATGTCHEQIVFNPVFVGGDMLVNTTTPPTSVLGQCSLPYPKGWTMSFNMASGGENTNGAFFGSGASGVGIGASGSPYIIDSAGSTSAPGTVSLISQGYNGASQLKPPPGHPQYGVTVKRVSWGILR